MALLEGTMDSGYVAKDTGSGGTNMLVPHVGPAGAYEGAMAPLGLSPKEVVERATEQADALMDVVEQKQLYAVIQGKKYLQAEAWETIGAFNNVYAEGKAYEWFSPGTEDEGKVHQGYRAEVTLRDKATGEKRGSAIMCCGFDENVCQGKAGTARDKAAMSAAQTWAMSKAYRMNYSFVAVLGGYEPTPAEEMQGLTNVFPEDIKLSPEEQYVHTNATPTPTGNICPIHSVEWFKKGKMKGYAHPIKGEKTPAGKDAWCNKVDAMKALEAPNQAPVWEEGSGMPETPPPKAPPAEESPAGSFDYKAGFLGWLEEIKKDPVNVKTEVLGGVGVVQWIKEQGGDATKLTDLVHLCVKAWDVPYPLSWPGMEA